MKKILQILVLFSLNSTIAQFSSIKPGEGTFYEGIAGSDTGNCLIFVAEGDYKHCALNSIDYDNAQACGGYIEVFGEKGSVVLQVVDRCPECKEGDVDMTREAFEKIDDPIKGRVPITWKSVESPKEEHILIKFKEGSSEFHTEIQFSQLKYPIKSLEYFENDSWIPMERKLYNFFVEPKGIKSPMKLRASSVNEEDIVFENVSLLVGIQDTGKQFTKSEIGQLSIESFESHIDMSFFNVFPNPFHSQINASFNSSWILYNSSLNKVSKGTRFPITNLNGLSQGNYYIFIPKKQRLIKLFKN